MEVFLEKEENLKDQINFDENDEVTDEEYFKDDTEPESFTGHAQSSQDVLADEFPDDEENQQQSSSEDEEEFEDYRVTSISEAFLRTECAIKNEANKTEIKFEYRGETLKGICIQKLPSGRWDYVFLVSPVTKGRKAATVEKKLRKICVQEAQLL